MKAIETNTIQKIVNKSINKLDFTFNLNDNDKRYIVSVKNIYLGFNPSLCTDLNLRINKAINNDLYDSIGGWKGYSSNNSRPYYLDANIHFNSLDKAKNIAIKHSQAAIFDKLNNIVININK